MSVLALISIGLALSQKHINQRNCAKSPKSHISVGIGEMIDLHFGQKTGAAFLWTYYFAFWNFD
jgi:hypothetical protein